MLNTTLDLGRYERKRADPTVLPHLEQNTWIYGKQSRIQLYEPRNPEGLDIPIEKSTTLGAGVTWTQDVLYKELQWYADVYLNTFDSKVIFDFDYSADSALSLSFKIP